MQATHLSDTADDRVCQTAVLMPAFDYDRLKSADSSKIASDGLDFRRIGRRPRPIGKDIEVAFSSKFVRRQGFDGTGRVLKSIVGE